MDRDRIEGAVEKAAGEARYRYGQANDQIKSLACETVQCVQRNPLTSLAIVGAVGFLIGAACRAARRD